jgi:hypothetical protein
VGGAGGRALPEFIRLPAQDVDLESRCCLLLSIRHAFGVEEVSLRVCTADGVVRKHVLLPVDSVDRVFREIRGLKVGTTVGDRWKPGY